MKSKAKLLGVFVVLVSVLATVSYGAGKDSPKMDFSKSPNIRDIEGKVFRPGDEDGYYAGLAGLYYLRGSFVEQNNKRAEKWIVMSAKKKHPFGLFGAGILLGSDKDSQTYFQKAFPKMMTLAESGDAEAQYDIGQCYENGYGTAKDLSKAAEFYQKASDLGYADAQYALGLCYKEGLGVVKDPSKSDELIKKAMVQGLQKAKNAFVSVSFDDMPNLDYLSAANSKDAEASILSLQKYFRNKFPVLNKDCFGIKLGESYQDVMAKLALSNKGPKEEAQPIRDPYCNDAVGIPMRQITFKGSLNNAPFVGETIVVFFQDIAVNIAVRFFCDPETMKNAMQSVREQYSGKIVRTGPDIKQSGAGGAQEGTIEIIDDDNGNKYTITCGNNVCQEIRNVMEQLDSGLSRGINYHYMAREAAMKQFLSKLRTTLISNQKTKAKDSVKGVQF